MIVPIYRPEIAVYERQIDGEWESRFGIVTSTLFYPIADDDGSVLTEAGFRRIVRLGEQPAFRIIAPDGSELFTKGRALFLRTPEDKALDAFSALVLAKRAARGLDLVRAGRPAPRFAPAPEPATSRPRGPALQLSLFAEGGVS